MHNVLFIDYETRYQNSQERIFRKSHIKFGSDFFPLEDGILNGAGGDGEITFLTASINDVTIRGRFGNFLQFVIGCR